MTLFNLLVLLAASAAGWAIFTAGLLVLRCMSVRRGCVFTAIAWLGTTFAGAWLGFVPAYQQEVVHWQIAVLAVSMSVLVWRNLPEIIGQATAPRGRRASLATMTALFVAGCTAPAPAIALEVQGRAIVLNDEEVAQCKLYGCTLITNTELLRQLDSARAIGCKAST